MAVVQSTSPMFARQSYWCIVETLKQAGFRTYPYHVYVPSFGEWGFVLAALGPYEPPLDLPEGLRFLSARNLSSLFEFPLDMQPVEAEPNRLNNQVLVRYYEREWSAISR
jgi:spermidine synthase